MKKSWHYFKRLRGWKKTTLSGILILVVIVAGALVFALAVSPGTVEPVGSGTAALAEKTFVDIGGVRQGMIIESTDTNNPVLLYVHGGPAFSEYAFIKHYNTGLEKLFTVCYWDQRNTCLSYSASIDPKTMTLEQIVADTLEVTNYLRERFGKEKIYILGHSWGTLVASHAVNQSPELYNAYIGVSQMSNTIKSETEIYNFLLSEAQARDDKAALKAFEAYQPDEEGVFLNNMQHFETRSTYAAKYGVGMLRNLTSMQPIMSQLFLCRAYTITEKLNYLKGFGLHELLMPYVKNTDLLEQISSQEIPVYIFAGEHDYYATPRKVAEEYFEMLDAPEKQFYVFENSAHSPMFEEPERFLGILEEIRASHSLAYTP